MAEPALADVAPLATSAPKRGFYQRVLRTFVRHELPCLVGGTYAFEEYTGIRRRTKDLDLFVPPHAWDSIVAAMQAEGISVTLTFPHWLGKALDGAHYVDLLFANGNGLASVDRSWFAHSHELQFWGVTARVCPVEELIWSKSYVMERERFDGADVLHLLRAQSERLDWSRLLDRFGDHWEVLLSHLILFGFVYPAERDRIPAWVMSTLLARLALHSDTVHHPRLNRGTLLSREQYLVDIEQGGDIDARLVPYGPLTRDLIAKWTAEVPESRRAVLRPLRIAHYSVRSATSGSTRVARRAGR
jgi:hypothetical protein